MVTSTLQIELKCILKETNMFSLSKVADCFLSFWVNKVRKKNNNKKSGLFWVGRVGIGWLPTPIWLWHQLSAGKSDFLTRPALSVCPSVLLFLFLATGDNFYLFFARQWTVVTQTQKLSKSWREGSTDRLRYCHSYEEKMFKTNFKKKKENRVEQIKRQKRKWDTYKVKNIHRNVMEIYS